MTTESTASTSMSPYPLSLDEYTRYGRQMILPGFGLPGQLKLKRAKVAVVGAGGLGCPVLQYLVGAGVGTIGIFDHDTVGVSNLHRQVLHTTDRVGMNKAESACSALQALNPHPIIIPHPEPVLPSTAMKQLQDYEIIVDCTDRPITRYLLSDVAVRLNKTLVSGAAISSAGQWAVYGGTYASTSSPSPVDKERPSEVERKRRACYRCVWPSLLPGSGGNGTCEEQGVWGAVTGIIGTGMASEVVKLVVGVEDSQPLLHLLHLNSNPLIRSIKLRPPSVKCIACGPNATITNDLESFEYETFCSGISPISKTTTAEEGNKVEVEVGRIGVKELSGGSSGKRKRLLVDTRPAIEFGICALPDSINVPLQTILSDPLTSLIPHDGVQEITFICRKGNDSQLAATSFKRALIARTDALTEPLRDESEKTLEKDEVRVNDVIGGLVAWSRDVDPEFPVY